MTTKLPKFLSFLCILMIGLTSFAFYNSKPAHADTETPLIQTLATSFATHMQAKDSQALQSIVQTTYWPRIQGQVMGTGAIGSFTAHSSTVTVLSPSMAYFYLEWTDTQGVTVLQQVAVRKVSGSWKVASIK